MTVVRMWNTLIAGTNALTGYYANTGNQAEALATYTAYRLKKRLGKRKQQDSDSGSGSDDESDCNERVKKARKLEYSGM